MIRKKVTSKIVHRKWETVYEDEYTISIWKYDSRKSNVNPYEVEIKYKKEVDVVPKTRKKKP
jgi:hypothetical protein